MGIVDKVQQVVDATPTPANWGIMVGSLILSFLQPVAIIVTVLWGCLQIHGYVKREFNRDFLWLSRLFNRKGK